MQHRRHRHVSRHLELQPRFARRVGERLDSSVIQKTAAVEDNAAHAGGLRLGGDRLADLSRLGDAVALGLDLDCRGGGQRPALAIVDELRVNMVEAAKNREPRPLRGPSDMDAHALMSLRTVLLAIVSLDHAVALAPLPALPALRRTFSSRYLTPLPL